MDGRREEKSDAAKDMKSHSAEATAGIGSDKTSAITVAQVSRGASAVVDFVARHRGAALVAAFALVHGAAAPCAPALSIDGRWLTFDEATHARRSIVEIERDGRRVTGRIVEIYAQSGEDPDPTCDRCTGANRGRKIRGMNILNMEADADGLHFSGTVLDPDDGKVYQGVVTLEADGRRLMLRGYVGLPLFGRTDIWSRFE